MKRILIVLLAVLLCTGMLFAAACTDETPDEEKTPAEETPTDDQTDTGLSFALADGSSRYTVMRSDLESGTHPVTAAAVSIRDALQEKLGTTVTIATDWDMGDPTPEEIAARYEICVGNTNRPESEAAKATLEQYSWTIRVDGNKIVIVGDSDKATVMAAQAFIATYIKGDGVISETLSVTETYTPTPTEIIPKDNSTGKMNPGIVTTVYPTEDVVIADVDVVKDGYAVDPTGMSDSTAGIQKALNDVSKAGGGTVWLPAGTYVVSGTINVPAFVTLRGDWQDPDTGNEYGTIISVWMEPEDAGKVGVFHLGGSGGVIGLTVYYPHQSLTDVKAYPFAFYTNGQGVNYMLATAKNITVINGYRGLGCCVAEGNAHEQMTVENFKGTFLYCGAEVYNQADVGTWQDVTVSAKYWQDALSSSAIAALSETAAPTAEEIATYVKENAVGLKLGDLEWTEFESLKVEGCKIGIEIVKGKRIQFAGSLYDTAITGCTQGIVVHDLDPRWGMVVANSTIENGIYNETDGMVKLCGVETTGALEGQISTIDQGDTLKYYKVDYTASYQKPIEKLYLFSTEKASSDNSAALQALLDEAGKTGGVVYVSAGHYRLDNPLTVPAGVELRGASSVANRDQGGLSAGTVFECFYGDDDESGVDDQAFITLAGENAGLNGIRIIYPENSPLGSNLNTTYTVRGTAKGVYMVNCGISASAYGVDFRGCDNHFIKKVTTCCYYNTFIVGGEGGILSGCLQNGTVIYRTSGAGLVNWPTAEGQIWAELFDPITRLYNNYIIVDGATDQLIYNTFIYGCASMVINRNSEDTLAVNIGSDNIGSKTAQIVMESGSLVVINSMRYNGHSYDYEDGELELYNRITINDKNEETLVLP
ncbi:MAG: hypothetical protein IJW40_06675 [Clostridia bacterium]|nr:hypothetical protein [Clostridia bacterium]